MENKIIRIKDNAVLFQILTEIEYSAKDDIMQIEQQAYENIREGGESLNALVVLATTQMMLGNRQKAIAIAYNIWDMGGHFDDYASLGYINLLINLGLFDLVSVFYKPKFENLEQNVDLYFYSMLKFALLSGDIMQMNRLLNYADENDAVALLFDFVEIYKEENYQEDFQQIMKIVFDKTKDVVCSFEYFIYDERENTDIEVVVYVGKEVSDKETLESKIEADIEKYFAQAMKKRIYNLEITVEQISEHSAMVG